MTRGRWQAAQGSDLASKFLRSESDQASSDKSDPRRLDHRSHLALADQGVDTTPRGFACDVVRLWVLCDVRRGLHDQSCSSRAPGSFPRSSDRSWAALPVQQGALRPSLHYFDWVFISGVGNPFFRFRCVPLAVMSGCGGNTDALKKIVWHFIAPSVQVNFQQNMNTQLMLCYSAHIRFYTVTGNAQTCACNPVDPVDRLCCTGTTIWTLHSAHIWVD